MQMNANWYHTLTLPVYFRFNQNIIYVIEVQTRNKNFKDEWRRLVPAAQCKSAEEPPSEVEEEVGYRQGNQRNNH